MANLLYEIIKRKRIAGISYEVLLYLVRNLKSLSISETTLQDFLMEAGIWKQGVFFPDEETAKAKRSPHSLDIFSYAELYSLKDAWLDSVRKVASQDGILETQKDALSIFFDGAS